MAARFRVVRVPDRWDIIVALLTAPPLRVPVEFWIRPPRASVARAVPVFMAVDSLVHKVSGLLELQGALTEASHVFPSGRAVCRFAYASGMGEMLVERF